MCHSFHNFSKFFFILRQVFLNNVASTKRKNHVLQVIYRCFSAKQEHTVLEKLPLFFRFILPLQHPLHLWWILKSLINQKVLFSHIEQFSDFALQITDAVAVQIARNIIRLWKINDWISHAAVRKKFIVNEFQQSNIEFSKCAHNFVIYIEWQPLIEFVWGNPGNLLPKNLNSVVYTLDGVESLSKALTYCAVKHKITIELATRLKFAFFYFECKMLRELCEKRYETKSIIEVTKCIYKGRIAFFNYRC